jgi:hypothetical protein
LNLRGPLVKPGRELFKNRKGLPPAFIREDLIRLLLVADADTSIFFLFYV